jgi:hypothetical protein
MSFSAQAILESPEYYPLKFEGSNLVFVQMSRTNYQQSIFTLPNRIVTQNNSTWTVPFTEIVSLLETAAPQVESPHVIFQIAHCGSTLLSRALDQPDSSLVIREPFALRQYCASPSSDDQEARLNRRRGLNALWTLLSRKFTAAETTLIKTNVPVNFSLSEISELVPQMNGVLLYCGFEEYMVSVLKSEQRKLWAKHVVSELATKIRRLKMFSDLELTNLTSARATAVLWMSQISNYQSALMDNHGYRSLNSRKLFENPSDTLVSCAQHLGIEIDNNRLQSIVSSELFSHHAKTPEREYSQIDRIAEQKRLLEQHSPEIEKVIEWCEQHSFSIQSDLNKYALF